jgi:hypothetical protein
VKACQKLLPKKVYEQLIGEVVGHFKSGVKLNNFEKIDKASKPYISQIKATKLSNVVYVKNEK